VVSTTPRKAATNVNKTTLKYPERNKPALGKEAIEVVDSDDDVAP
jgi:hypothetical protein